MQANPNGGGGVPPSPKPKPLAGYSISLKLMMLGASGVGKTAILERFTNNTFSPNFITTIGVDFKVKTVQLGNGLKVKAQIWDPTGQDKFQTVVSGYYRGTQGYVLVYDVQDPDSLLSLDQHWIPEVRRHGDADAKFVLVGNKCDMSQRTAVTQEEGQRFADHYGCPFFLASAKSNDNITRVFDKLISDVAKQVIEDGKGGKSKPAPGSLAVSVDLNKEYVPPKSFCQWFCGGWWGSSAATAPEALPEQPH